MWVHYSTHPGKEDEGAPRKGGVARSRSDVGRALQMHKCASGSCVAGRVGGSGSQLSRRHHLATT